MNMLRCIREWFLLTTAAFLLYIILWFPILQKEFSWEPFDLFIDFSYCGIFILTSMIMEYIISRKPRIHELTPTKLTLDGLLTLCINLILGFLFESFSAKFLWPIQSKDGFWFSVYIFCIIASIVSQFHIVRNYNKLINLQRDENLALTKTMLKSQLNPHFIFNSLNILTGLIKENPDRAEQFTVSLSKIYRYIINSLEKDVIPISTALTFAKDYISIMQTRFPSSISFDDCNQKYDDNDKILTMSMQLLIENAVKHNSPSPEHPLQILVFKRGDFLVISNSLADSEQDAKLTPSHNGVGLKNLQRRYLIECGKEPIIRTTTNDDSRFFEVSLPIIHQL